LTISIEDLKRWQPDKFSEDHIDNLVLRVLGDEMNWHLVYYNPPHGSWKFLSLVRGDFEYRQVGPKRGVGRLRRPDIALQDLDTGNSVVRLFLIESKMKNQDWDPKLANDMKSYFEGVTGFDESKGIRLVPIRHRRKRGTESWTEIDEDDSDRDWFRRVDPQYVYGFVYSVGRTSPDFNGKSELSWILSTIDKLKPPVPPIALMAVGWKSSDLGPFILRGYSSTFPKDISKRLEDAFRPFDLKPRVAGLDLFTRPYA